MVEETEEHMGKVLLAYGTPLMAFYSFRYLGRTLSSSNDDWLEMEGNLRRARGKWGRLEKILGREGEDMRTVGRFYVEVVQEVILFGYKTWVLKPWLEKFIKGFQHRVVWRMAGMCPKRQRNGTWVYPSIGAALEMVGLE